MESTGEAPLAVLACFSQNVLRHYEPEIYFF